MSYTGRLNQINEAQLRTLNLEIYKYYVQALMGLITDVAQHSNQILPVTSILKEKKYCSMLCYMETCSCTVITLPAWQPQLCKQGMASSSSFDLQSITT